MEQPLYTRKAEDDQQRIQFYTSFWARYSTIICRFWNCIIILFLFVYLFIFIHYYFILGEEVERVTHFKYLGTSIEEEGGMETEIAKRVGAGWMNWKKCSGVLC